jgi:hypothetical protein
MEGSLEVREVDDTDVPFSVIASEARQSMNPEVMDCRVAVLLAMTSEWYFGNF